MTQFKLDVNVTIRLPPHLEDMLQDMLVRLGSVWLAKGTLPRRDDPKAAPADDFVTSNEVRKTLFPDQLLSADEIEAELEIIRRRNAPEPNPGGVAPDDAATVAVSSPTQPPAGATPAAAFLGGVWTDERNGKLVAMRANGAAWEVIWQTLNAATAGLPIKSSASVAAQFNMLRKSGKIARFQTPPKPVQAAPLQPAPARRLSPPTPPVARPSGPQKPERMTLTEATQWASQRGLCNGADATFNLAAVNAKRLRLGLAEIELTGRRG